MDENKWVLLIVSCLILSAGCSGIEQQQTETISAPLNSKLIIEDNYPNEFSVVVRGTDNDQLLFNESFDGSDHGTINLSSVVPSDQPVMVTIASDETILWDERVERYEGYTLKIQADGTVDETLIEV